MRNIFVLMCCFLLSANLVLANETVLLKGSVVKVPDTFFGSWRVVSKLVDTDSPISFKEKGVDLWNISLENNVIKLSNPFSGAVAELNVENTSSDSVTFTKEGKYDVTDEMKSQMTDFVGGYATEEETFAKIKALYEDCGYVIDTHTAVAYKVYQDYVAATGDETPTLIASTASPYKFAESVGRAIGLPEAEDGFAAVRALNEKTGVYVQKGLKDLDKKPVLHTGVCEVGGQAEAVLEALK